MVCCFFFLTRVCFGYFIILFFKSLKWDFWRKNIHTKTCYLTDNCYLTYKYSIILNFSSSFYPLLIQFWPPSLSAQSGAEILSSAVFGIWNNIPLLLLLIQFEISAEVLSFFPCLHFQVSLPCWCSLICSFTTCKA